MRLPFSTALIAFAFFPFVIDLESKVADSDEPPEGWSQPVPLEKSNGWNHFSSITASSDGIVHAFWQSDPSKLSGPDPGDPGADNLWYSQIKEGVVGKPENILVPPPRGSFQQSIHARIDQQNRIHLFLWYRPPCLQHSIARREYALSPQEWMGNSTCIGETTFGFGVTQDDIGQIHLAYATPAGRLNYARFSPDTNRWSPPITAFFGKEDVALHQTRIAVDSRGKIHVIWVESEAPNWYPPNGVFYVKSIDGGDTWTAPERLSPVGHSEPEIVAIGNDQIHVAWNGSVRQSNRYHRFSADAGRTWSALHTFKVRGGFLGQPALAVDSAKVLHAILSSDDGLYYANWSEPRGWSEMELIVPGVSTGSPAAVIAGGNQLHITYREGSRTIWYMNRLLDSPVLAPEPILAPSSQDTDPVSVVTPDPALQSKTQDTEPALPARSYTSTQTSIELADQPTRSLMARQASIKSKSSTISPILAGLAPAALLVIVALASIKRQR